MVAKMMSNEKATHLMFIDADIRFPAESIISLLNANKPIVAGAYPKKSLPIDYAINKKPGGEVHGSLVEVITAATGFMMIERSVLTDMMVAYPKTKYCDSVGFGGQYEPYMFALFDTAIDSESHYLSEDWTFCRRWIDLQGQIFIDTNIKLDHIGSYSYAGALDQLRK